MRGRDRFERRRCRCPSIASACRHGSCYNQAVQQRGTWLFAAALIAACDDRSAAGQPGAQSESSESEAEAESEDECALPCHYCWAGTAQQDDCPGDWNGGNNGCDCDCQFEDADCDSGGESEGAPDGGAAGDGDGGADGERENCGNGFCGAGESCTACPADCVCPDCGDGLCEDTGGENCFNCVGDCPTCTVECGDGLCHTAAGESADSCAADCTFTCGDGVCDALAGESSYTCALECSDDYTTCDDGVCDFWEGEPDTKCGYDGSGCEYYGCGDAICADGPPIFEDCTACPLDCSACGSCGDGTCDDAAGENCLTCVPDCGDCAGCGNHVCVWSDGETCDTCPEDCIYCEICGDGICTAVVGEDCAFCPDDCGACGDCGDGYCSATEDCASCADDCGACEGSCADPVALDGTSGALYRFAGDVADAPGCGFGPEAVHVWTAPADGAVRFQTCAGASFDTVVSVHEGTCDGAEIDCNDDWCFSASRVCFAAVTGATYYVFVGVADPLDSDAGGQYNLAWAYGEPCE